MKLIFATNNQHKADEIQAVLPPVYQIITLKAAGISIDIPEPHDTLEANAKEKAVTIYHLTNTACFGEDTGLEVDALNGEPGVRSARYAGDDKLFQNNIEKLLFHLKDKQNREAQFRTVICLIIEGNIEFFEGICKGRIIAAQKGKEGFGYDPVFVPDGAEKTFAEMSLEEKNQYSHRRKAVDKLVSFLNQFEQNL
ncbi:MAG: RdgB/HAM1 family non-canonical purine NTP pyrophosphatase [Chitinophagaceae bacterium]|nr:MAG: RdgB/HAM1 family non-canonical purine NTP pyrophosphatase [Chitinophagaceae bacterium]